MPYVNVKIGRGPISAEQKQTVISGITQVIAQELGKKPETVWVVIEEIPTDNWGVGGESLTDLRARLG
jgi:4-oxalocrotonate tautomerase